MRFVLITCYGLLSRLNKLCEVEFYSYFAHSKYSTSLHHTPYFTGTIEEEPDGFALKDEEEEEEEEQEESTLDHPKLGV